MKQNNNIWIIVGIIVLVFIIMNNKNTFSGATIPLVSGHTICYQEQSNISTPGDGNCGLVYTGNYIDPNHISGGAGLWRDGDWSAFSFTVIYTDSSFSYVDYFKPTNALISSLWQVRTGYSTSFTDYNISFNSACWNAYPNKIRLALDSRASVDNAKCYNGTNWIGIGNIGGLGTIKEESMWWDITSCTPSCTCASTTCTGTTCSNGCGGTCAGTKTCNTCNNAADTTPDCVISNTELLSYINLWKAGTATRDNLGIAIDIWINGGY